MDVDPIRAITNPSINQSINQTIKEINNLQTDLSKICEIYLNRYTDLTRRAANLSLVQVTLNDRVLNVEAV
jgi:flagellar capping protein FliD